MTSPWTVVPLFAGAYLCGSIPFGWLIGKMRGVDIRQHGSRNIGATNCGRVCGAPWGVLAFLLDVAKGFGPVFLAAQFGAPALAEAHGQKVANLLLVAVAVAPILGHVFPVWLRFHGGKAVATSLGVVLALPLLWPIALLALGVWILAVLISGYVSVGSTAAALVFLGGYLVACRDTAWNDGIAVTFFVLALVTVVLVRHRSNYARLARGKENRIWGRRREERGRAVDKPSLDQDVSVPAPPQESNGPRDGRKT